MADKVVILSCFNFFHRTIKSFELLEDRTINLEKVLI